MIKLIATDMDGTLLNNNHEMPANTFAIIDQLHARGITFAVASGRGHHSILKLYDQIKDDIVMITNNGAIIIDHGEIIFSNPLDRDIAREIVDAVTAMPNLHLMIKSLKCSYFFGTEVIGRIPADVLNDHFPLHQIVDSFDEIPLAEEILQITVADPAENAQVNAYDKLTQFLPVAHLAISGEPWLDIMAKGVNKGQAIAQLQAILKADAVETMVFGDQMNDYEMMEQAYYSYAMANAVAPIKAVANFAAPSNEDEGVTRIIENFLKMTENTHAWLF